MYNYFQNLFVEQDNLAANSVITPVLNRISVNDLLLLNQPFTPKEVKGALFDMAPFKTPGVNGLHAGFYQKMWETVGDCLCKCTLQFFTSGILPEGINDTLLILFPKIQYSEQLSHLRPISLYNVSYKVITKTLTNRLKKIMPNVVALNQSNFMPGR